MPTWLTGEGQSIQVQIEDQERAILAQVARGRGIGPEALLSAVEHESTAELAQVLQIDTNEAGAWLDRVRRIVTIGDDWGAGCRLLTDELRVELHAELWKLRPDTAHSTSSGGSQG